MAEWIKMEEALGENDIRLFSRGGYGPRPSGSGRGKRDPRGYRVQVRGCAPQRGASSRPRGGPAWSSSRGPSSPTSMRKTAQFTSLNARRFLRRSLPSWSRAYRAGAPVKGTVVAEVSGAGFQVDLGGIRAFLPASHLGKGISTKFERLRGKALDLKIIEFSRRTRNIVVSRKEWQKDQEERAKDELFASLTPGKVIEGTVKSVVDFGIFVDVGGHDGLVHRTEICWKDIPAPPPGKFKPGQKIKVMVLEADRKEERISLSIKRLRPNPWEGIAQRYPVGAKVKGENCFPHGFRGICGARGRRGGAHPHL
jgi:predicted RNA-binding protein with RPS1 domain